MNNNNIQTLFHILSDAYHCTYTYKEYMVSIPNISDCIQIYVRYDKYKDVFIGDTIISMFKYINEREREVKETLPAINDSPIKVINAIIEQISSYYNDGYVNISYSNYESIC